MKYFTVVAIIAILLIPVIVDAQTPTELLEYRVNQLADTQEKIVECQTEFKERLVGVETNLVFIREDTQEIKGTLQNFNKIIYGLLGIFGIGGIGGSGVLLNRKRKNGGEK